MENKSDHLPDVTKMMPMTLEQLRQMDGEPVWCKSLINGKSEWAILRIVEMSKTWFVALAGASQGFGDKDTYGKSWIAYAYHPAHIDLEAWKECPWCKSEYTIIDDDFGQPVHPNMVKFCWSCGRPLTPEARDVLEKRLRGCNE